MKAIPLPAGRASRNRLNVSNPPAEAPIATTVNGSVPTPSSGVKVVVCIGWSETGLLAQERGEPIGFSGTIPMRVGQLGWREGS
jgi:hypothetical protein